MRNIWYPALNIGSEIPDTWKKINVKTKKTNSTKNILIEMNNTCWRDLITSAGNITVQSVTPAIPPEIAVLNNPISSLVFPEKFFLNFKYRYFVLESSNF